MSRYGNNNKADTAVKLVLIFFISLLSFSVGTYVGKQVSDSDARRAALETDYSEGSEEQAQTDATTTEDEATAPISDEEVASLTEEFVKNDRTVASADATAQEADTKTDALPDEDGYVHQSKIKAASDESIEAATSVERTTAATATTTPIEAATVPTTTPAAAAPAKVENAPAAAAQRIAENQAPAADAKPVAVPSSALPSVATTAVGKFTVQVVSYATEAEAKEQAAQLTSKGYSAFYVPAEVNGKVWYRVSIGLFADQKSATNYRAELLSTKAVSTAIVQKIVK